MTYATCKRCGRPIDGHESIQRGYGSTCWRKIKKQTRQNEQLLSEGPRTIADQVLAAQTIRAIRALLADCERTECTCHHHVPTRDMDIRSYDHPCGYHLPGFENPQWVYLECPSCGYQWSWWKLHGPSLQVLENTSNQDQQGDRE